MNPYIYKESDSLLHDLDPRAKITALLLIFISISAQASPVATIVTTVLVLIWAQTGHAYHGVRRIWLVLASIMVMSTVIWGFLYEGAGFSSVGLKYGVISGVKIDAMIVAGVTFLAVTRHEEVGWGLQRMGVPYRVTFVISMALRLVPVFICSAYTVMQAQSARGMDLSGGSPVKRVKRYLALFGPLLITALRVTGPLTQALEAKGFGRGTRTSLLDFKWRFKDSIVVFVWIIIAGWSIWVAIG